MPTNHPPPEQQISALLELVANLTRGSASKPASETDARVAMPRRDPREYEKLPGFLEAARAFSLSLFELDLLALVAAFEVEPSWMNGHLEAGSGPTVAWLLDRLAIAESERAAALSSLLPGARLFQFGVLSAEGNGPLLTRTLRVPDDVWPLLLELSIQNDALRACAPDPRLLDRLILPASVVQEVAALAEDGTTVHRMLVVRGADGSGRKALASAIAGRRGRAVLTVTPRDLGRWSAPTPVLRALRWQNAVPVVDSDDLDDERTRELLNEWHDEVMWVAPVEARAPAEIAGTRAIGYVDLPEPDSATRSLLWQQVLPARCSDDVRPEELAYRYRFGPGRIRQAVAMAEAEKTALGESSLSRERLDASCRRTSDRINGLAQRLRLDAESDDLVVPDEVKRELGLVMAWLRHGATLMADWDVARRLGVGRSLACLFHGPPGTGKTLAARVLARTSGLDLYRVDLSQVVNKYIGETEKNLGRLFEEARSANALLFFDEADALFGKRTEVKDAHDRYANLETGFLLQRIEEHEGCVILATNLHRNMDEAFLRRIHVVAEFPIPGPAERLRIWDQHIPSRRTDDVDLEFLAQRFAIAGGDIRNAVLTGVLLAADEGVVVGMAHLVRGLWRELRKAGHAMEVAKFGEWGRVLENVR